MDIENNKEETWKDFILPMFRALGWDVVAAALNTRTV